MGEAMEGRLFNSAQVLAVASLAGEAPGSSSPLTNERGQGVDGADILEFLIKTEMEDSVGTENLEDNATVNTDATQTEGPTTMGWRRISECSYKMTEQETERMIKLRAVNEALFTGRKHTAKPAWRAILNELGLQGKLTTDQLAKKWDNLKRRYKELKCPARSMESNPNSWPWFYRMNDAMEGRFAGCAPILTPVVEEGDEEFEPSPPPGKRARRTPGRGGMSEFLTESEMDELVETEERNGAAVFQGATIGEYHTATEFSYKLTEEDTKRLIELRASNEALFTGKRNTAKPAWRAIVKEMGLAGKLSADQVAKKWDNLKTKFKDLKYPPRGMENQSTPASWPWFQLMNDAFEGRLAARAPKITPIWMSEEDYLFVSSPMPTERDPCPMPERSEISELEEGMRPEGTEVDGTVTFLDASGEECPTPVEFSYKMTEQDTRRLIKLRAANEVLFTGRRNAAKAAWKAILKELGLLGKVSTYQVAKKWDNLKRRYKDLKYPPVGMESIADNAASWPWFYLMNEAMEGRLAASGPVLTPITEGDDPEPSPSQSSRNRGCPLLEKGDITLEYEQEIYVDPTIEECHRATAECESALIEERLGRGPAGGTAAQKSVTLEREWEMVERERAAIERDRAAVDRERQWLESERANLARDRMLLEQDMAALGREREAFESQRAAVVMNSATGVHTGHVNHCGMGM
ncbi:uncharacterized protein LOC129862310 isoform X1 [Salvelinus fontinalis]|uniref:uncharacterized protein LOC129862310 isoform X1 n=1 Tax=Salvelinus fontinalis TaxID=8038 RepID=UPI002485CC3A|nr:uncharacterized protein LOC129862310 isoform X1 [Salvelinus fontinalis]XP_055789795.1 uncharacterized protein LOC129862310 isoform X1 [Salvelinus fontinalis]XP_055789796.1 uncharacterized protein LOC129862310 isoform X1 [Salvelinus fontinalis]